jgi:hypothetical protein
VRRTPCSIARPRRSLSPPPKSTPDAPTASNGCAACTTARLTETGGDLSPDDARELKAMAAIYDLDTDRPATEVWRDLRAVVTSVRRRAPTAEIAAPAKIEALTLLVVEDDAEAAADLTELLTEAGPQGGGPVPQRGGGRGRGGPAQPSTAPCWTSICRARRPGWNWPSVLTGAGTCG